jgi:stage III sporulation protein AH
MTKSKVGRKFFMCIVINRRHIIVASLVVVLAVAIFLNWKFSQPNNMVASANASTNLGDAVGVDTQNVSGISTDFFAEARLSRSQVQDEAEETLKTVTSNSAATDAERAQAFTNVNQIAKDIITENQIETLIKAKGFTECVCLINDGSASIVVKPKTDNSLSANDVAQIDDIVISETKFSANNIKIISEN